MTRSTELFDDDLPGIGRTIITARDAFFIGTAILLIIVQLFQILTQGFDPRFIFGMLGSILVIVLGIYFATVNRVQHAELREMQENLFDDLREE